MKKIYPVKADSYVFMMDNLIPSGNKCSVDKQCNNYERLTSETEMWFNKKALHLFSESIFSYPSVSGHLSLFVFRVINITQAIFGGSWGSLHWCLPVQMKSPLRPALSYDGGKWFLLHTHGTQAPCCLYTGGHTEFSGLHQKASPRPCDLSLSCIPSLCYFDTDRFLVAV